MCQAPPALQNETYFMTRVSLTIYIIPIPVLDYTDAQAGISSNLVNFYRDSMVHQPVKLKHDTSTPHSVIGSTGPCYITAPEVYHPGASGHYETDDNGLTLHWRISISIATTYSYASYLCVPRITWLPPTTVLLGVLQIAFLKLRSQLIGDSRRKCPHHITGKYLQHYSSVAGAPVSSWLNLCLSANPLSQDLWCMYLWIINHVCSWLICSSWTACVPICSCYRIHFSVWSLNIICSQHMWAEHFNWSVYRSRFSLGKYVSTTQQILSFFYFFSLSLSSTTTYFTSTTREFITMA